MVLPSDMMEQEEVEEKTEKTKEEEAEEEEGKVKMKEGTEEGPTPEELDQAVVVVPTPPDTGKIPHGLPSYVEMTVTSD